MLKKDCPQYKLLVRNLEYNPTENSKNFKAIGINYYSISLTTLV